MENDRDTYRYSLTVSSQFPFCGIPLRLDTYSDCQFSCTYCFAAARGGNTQVRQLQVADAGSFAARLQRVREGTVASVVDEMLAKRIPIHLGGMSDPFPPIERKLKITQAHLKAASSDLYPVILSTKSLHVAEDEILRILQSGRFAVQISFSTLSDSLGKLVDLGAPLPSRRLSAMRQLADAGVPVSGRIQPALPGRDSDVEELIDACAHAGARHVAVEHLKVPVERGWRHKGRLSTALGFDVVDYYQKCGSLRVGREWVLPVTMRLPKVLRYRQRAKASGISFGAADTDLLHLSDGSVCCSGADLLGLGQGFEYNYLEAVRRRDSDGLVTLESLEDAWAPDRSIRQYVNSRSRRSGSSIRDYINSGWGCASNGSTVGQFYGVERVEQCANHRPVFRVTREVERLIKG